MRNTAKRTCLVAAVASTALVLAGANSALATPVSSASTPPAHVSSVHTYNDTDLALLLLSGTGAAAKAHPEVLRQLGWAAVTRHFTQNQANDFVQRFLNANPNFHNAVSVPLQSGDPFKVQTALLEITKELRIFAKPSPAADASAAAASASVGPDASYKTRTNVVTNYQGAINLVAAVNGGLYANVAVATEVLIAAAVVWLAGIFLTYRFDASTTSNFDSDLLLASLAHELKAS